MNANQSLLDELDEAIASRSIGHRAAMLRRVADLFSVTSNPSNETIAIFDDIMRQLVDEIEVSARAAFGEYLTRSCSAPPGILRRLALDDAIVVARPVLSQSEQLDEATLVEGAKCKSQAHLLAMSVRRQISEAVTDILVERGSREVALSAAGNPGAAFSEFGYAALVWRSSSDDDLAVCASSRPEFPRQHLLKLFAEASESVKLKLTNRDPRKAKLVLGVVAQAASQLQRRTREISPEFAAARSVVQSLSSAGKLDEAQLADFANFGKFEETAVALSIICDVSVGLVERALSHVRSEQIVVLTRAWNLSWEATKAVLRLWARTNHATPNMDRIFETFMRLKPETAKKAVQFYRLRERSVAQQPR